MSLREKRALVDHEAPGAPSVRRQCEILGINRSSLYYEPVPMGEADVRFMNMIDEEFTKRPCLGSRQMVWRLHDLWYSVGRKRVRRLMRHMGLQAVFPRKNISRADPGHPVYPYLLRDLEIVGANQVWSMDITYIRLGKGFVYLAAVVDWHSRYVLSWRLSNTLTADFCVECLEEALQRGKPEIFNTDQGCQFTSQEFTAVLLDRGIRISMDGRGRAKDFSFSHLTKLIYMLYYM